MDSFVGKFKMMYMTSIVYYIYCSHVVLKRSKENEKHFWTLICG